MMKHIAKQKFYFDIGNNLLSVVQFCFVVIAASDKIAARLETSAQNVVIIFVPSVMFAVWLTGYLADKYGFTSAYIAEHNERNAKLKEIAEK